MERRRNSETRTLALTADEVRERIVDEHQRLRRLLVDVQGLARAVALESVMAPALRSALHVLLVEFALHVESEERILLPLLERSESPGPDQAASLRLDHERQRAQLRAMFSKVDDDRSESSAARLAEATDGFVLSVLRDMRDEEISILGEVPASLRQSGVA